MKKLNKNYLITCIIVLLILVGVGSIYYSYSRPVVSKKESIVVSPNVIEEQIDEKDVPLQVIKTEKIDNIEGINKLVGLVGDNEAIVRIGMNRKEIEGIYDKYKNNISEDENQSKFIKEINGNFYKLNLSTGQKEPLNMNGDVFRFSPDKTKYIYYANNKDNSDLDSMYIHDVKSNLDKEIKIGPIVKFEWSKDSKYIIAMNYKEKNMYFTIYDVEKDTVKEIKMNNNIVQQYIPIYVVNGQHIYIKAIMQNENNKTERTDGVYRINVDSEKVEPIMMLTTSKNDEQMDNAAYGPFAVINKGKSVIFSGKINGERGLFIYDVENKKFNKVDESKNDFIRFYISPDEDKIAYCVFRETNGNKPGTTANMVGSIYTAKIKDSKLENKILLCKDIDSYNFNGANSIIWSNDSKKVVISEFRTFDIDVKTSNIDTLSIVEKGIIHSIYFK